MAGTVASAAAEAGAATSSVAATARCLVPAPVTRAIVNGHRRVGCRHGSNTSSGGGRRPHPLCTVELFVARSAAGRQSRKAGGRHGTRRTVGRPTDRGSTRGRHGATALSRRPPARRRAAASRCEVVATESKGARRACGPPGRLPARSPPPPTPRRAPPLPYPSAVGSRAAPCCRAPSARPPPRPRRHHRPCRRRYTHARPPLQRRRPFRARPGGSPRRPLRRASPLVPPRVTGRPPPTEWGWWRQRPCSPRGDVGGDGRLRHSPPALILKVYSMHLGA